MILVVDIMNKTPIPQQALYEENLGAKGKWGIYKTNGTISFDYNCLADASTQEWESFHDKYPTNKFMEAIRELQKTGKAKIRGELSELEITVKEQGRLNIDFKYISGNGIYISDVVCDPSTLAEGFKK